MTPDAAEFRQKKTNLEAHHEILLRIARTANDVLRAHSIAVEDRSPPAPWSGASDEQKDSILDGVLSIDEGRVVSPKECHDNWVELKVATGWTYEPIIDRNKKHHPCLLPYGALTRTERSKDAIFFTLVRELLTLLAE